MPSASPIGLTEVYTRRRARERVPATQPLHRHAEGARAGVRLQKLLDSGAAPLEDICRESIMAAVLRLQCEVG
jgi:hypothetical protein